MPQELTILSPEKTVVTFRLAGIGARMLACFLDHIIIGTLIFATWFIASFIAVVVNQGLAMYVFGLSLLIYFAYFALLEGFWNGQTLGKKATRIRVRMADGTPITFGSAVGRNLLRVGDFLPLFYFLGLLAIFTNPRSQRIGDLAAGKIVILEKRVEARFAPTPYSQGVHPFEEHVGSLRGMANVDYLALRQLCDRFPELATNVQDRLIKEIWEPTAEKFKIEPIPNVHPIYLAEAVVMKYGRSHGLL